tara:strand:+ start:41096 stop:41464 length:369 start_codon:yes stop_codon:yes gene_type:complete
MSYTNENSILPQADLILQSVLIGIFFIGLWFFVHISVTWNRYHRPIPPIFASILLSMSPLLAIDPSGLALDSVIIHFGIYANLGLILFLSFSPLFLAVATFQAIRLSINKPLDDPLIEMLDN